MEMIVSISFLVFVFSTSEIFIFLFFFIFALLIYVFFPFFFQSLLYSVYMYVLCAVVMYNGVRDELNVIEHLSAELKQLSILKLCIKKTVFFS